MIGYVGVHKKNPEHGRLWELLPHLLLSCKAHTYWH